LRLQRSLVSRLWSRILASSITRQDKLDPSSSLTWRYNAMVDTPVSSGFHT
jgi:hypothetical protein